MKGISLGSIAVELIGVIDTGRSRAFLSPKHREKTVRSNTGRLRLPLGAVCGIM